MQALAQYGFTITDVKNEILGGGLVVITTKVSSGILILIVQERYGNLRKTSMAYNFM